MRPQRIAVIGAGIIGVTTAFELALRGHLVTVFEKNQTCAEESSFANAGVISPGYVTPWASPDLTSRLARDFFAQHSSFLMHFPNMRELKWLSQCLKASKSEHYWSHRNALQRLALKSQARMQELAHLFRLEFEQTRGYSLVYRDPKSWQQAQLALPHLSAQGIPYQLLTHEQLLEKEPALESATALAGAIHLPQDQVANCRQFAMAVRDEAERLGVEFRFKSDIQPLDPQRPREIINQGQRFEFDKTVVCAGTATGEILRDFQLPLDIQPIYGYSLTALIKEPLDAPQCGLMDDQYKVTLTRQGHRIRVGGIMELGGVAKEHNAKAIKTLYKVLEDWFPKASDWGQQVQVWKGARPMRPQGTPLVCETPVTGVWLNAGHGSSGWALSCACAQLLCGLMEGEHESSEWPELGWPSTPSPRLA
jgi:D-amino-acid dehydrogenase